MPDESPLLPNHPISPVPPPRVMRVFISSTFRDMMRERDLLVKQVKRGASRKQIPISKALK